MSHKSRLPIFIGSGLLLFIMIVVLTSLAMAQAGTPKGSTGESVIPNPDVPLSSAPGGPGFISVSPFAFRAYNASNSYAFNGQMLYNPVGGLVAYVTSIALPHGATITKLVVYYYDNDAANDITLFLTQGEFTSSYTYGIASAASTGSSETIRRAEAAPYSNTVIDNQNNTYNLEVFIPYSSGGEVALGGIRVDYGYPAMLPLIQK